MNNQNVFGLFIVWTFVLTLFMSVTFFHYGYAEGQRDLYNKNSESIE